MASPAATDDRLAAAVRLVAEPVAADLDVEVLEVRVSGPAGRRVVQLTADAVALHAPPLDVDTIAALSRRLGEALDADQKLIPGAYTLEVTSPGTDRPLHTPRDLARNLGREVRLTRRGEPEEGDGADGTEGIEGTLRAVTQDDVTVEVDGEDVTLPLAELAHGRVVLPW
jgi:ribosome maturation factor RimP